MKSGNLNFLEHYGQFQACNGTAALHRFTLKMETLRLSETSINACQSTGFNVIENFDLYHLPLRTSDLKRY